LSAEKPGNSLAITEAAKPTPVFRCAQSGLHAALISVPPIKVLSGVSFRNAAPRQSPDDVAAAGQSGHHR